MKNITLAIDEGLLERARIFAASRQTTVNRLVRDLLAQTVDEEARLADTRRQLKALMAESAMELGSDYVWNREDLYADRLLPRHERPDIRGGKTARSP